MCILKYLHANRMAVVLGSGLLCLLGFMAGCEGGPAGSTAAETQNKAKQEEEAKARQAAYGKTGYQTKTVKNTPKR